MYTGGYSHAPDDLSYGVDMKKIRWCGILQVQFSSSKMKKSVHPRFIYVSKKLILFYWLHIGSSENCFGVLRGFSDSGIHHNGTACHRAVRSIRHFLCIPVAMVHKSCSSLIFILCRELHAYLHFC
jgi:hypothetical protein